MPSCLFRNVAQHLLFPNGKQYHADAVHRNIGLQYHARISERLRPGFHLALADVIEAGNRILYNPAVGAHGHVYHRILIGYFLVLRSEENQRAAPFRIFCHVRHILSGQTVKVCKEGAEHDILVPDECFQVGKIMYSVLQCPDKQLAVCRANVVAINGKGRNTVKRTEERPYTVCGIRQIPVAAIGRSPFLEDKHILTGTAAGPGQTDELHAERIVNLPASVVQAGMGMARRVLSRIEKDRILENLPTVDMSHQFIRRKAVLAPDFTQELSVYSDGVIFHRRLDPATSITARNGQGYGYRNGNQSGQK